MNKNFARVCFLTSIYAFCFLPVMAQQHVLTQHNDISRTGWNNQETILNTKNVRPGAFGKLFTRAVDDQLYAQPLVMSNVDIPAVGLRNVLYLATVNNTVYAFDADSASRNVPYWQVNLSPAGTRAVKNTDMTGACGGGYRDFSGNMGIVGTPVIDASTNTIFLVARSVGVSGNGFEQYLHALDIRTGAERPNSPKRITAQVNGNGDGAVGGKVNFDPQKQNQRAGLLLVNDMLYIAWASHCDWGPYHGWIMGYDKTSLQQNNVYNTTPEGYNGGIWMSGGGPSADENGNIYAAVGNGSIGKDADPANPINRSESALKLTPNATGGFNLGSFFSPKNIQDLEAADLDFGVTEVLLIPGTNRAMTSCKDGKIYLLDRDNMGGFNAATNNVLQTIDLGTNAHLRSSFAYYKGQQNEYVYSWSENALLKAFPYSRSTNLFDLGQTISSGAQGPTGNNGAFLATSSNGNTDSTAILWTSFAANGDANQSVRPGILRAFAATDVTKELWNSSQYPSDMPGNYAKFNCPTIANGKVYLATFSNQLVVYGLTGNNAPDTCHSTNLALGRPAMASSLESNAYSAVAAFDGNPATRWSSAYADPQWISVDLGSRYDLCKVVLKWETALGRDFKIQVSDDAQNWTSLINMTGNTDAENYLPVQGSGRYVRMFGSARGTPYGYSLWEFEVYGRPSANSCASPNGLTTTNIYENAVTLHWNGNGAGHFNVQYKTVSAVNWTQVRSDSTSITLNGLACATDYFFKVQGVCSNTDSSAFSVSSPFSTLACNSNCGPLPTRWTTQDIGDVGVAGSACYNNGIFELHGSGTDIWDALDEFRFAYKTLVGDGEIKARILSMDASNQWNKCGIMIRENLSAGSRHAFIALTSGNGVAFQNRPVADGNSNNVNTGQGITAPHWIKLVKQGTLYTAFHSVDGNRWVQLGNPTDLGFGSGIPVYAGLALTSHNNSVSSTATVDNYVLSGIVEVELQRFTASLTLNRTVAIQWTTTLEKNIRYFVVERSADNVHFRDIDTVAAVNNGRYTQNYSSEDLTPLQGFNFYRLRITNVDGTVSYSAPAFVRVSASNAPLLFPNPARSVVHIAQGTEPIRGISIFDMSGRMVKRAMYNGSPIVDIPVHAWSNGMYIIQIKTNSAMYTQKLVIHN